MDAFPSRQVLKSLVVVLLLLFFGFCCCYCWLLLLLLLFWGEGVFVAFSVLTVL